MSDWLEAAYEDRTYIQDEEQLEEDGEVCAICGEVPTHYPVTPSGNSFCCDCYECDCDVKGLAIPAGKEREE